jgi:mono/diheme cytochrome c family protein
MKKLTLAAAAALVGIAFLPAAPAGQTPQVTFSKDIAPILQRSCQSCHRPDSLAPMSLINYEEVRPFARSIKQRTGLRNKRGVMPPWFIEKDTGIQQFKDDISLSDAEVATIAKWADAGAPRAIQPICRRLANGPLPTSGRSVRPISSSTRRLWR